MADIHLHTPGGETIVHPEERVVELLQSGGLAPETLFWRSGMPDWEPIANFTPDAVVPATQRLPELSPTLSGEQAAEAADRAARAHVSPTKPLPDLTKPRSAPDESDLRHVHATGRRRFSFRRDPEPLTTILQVILVICICGAALELANAVVHYTSLATETPAVLDADGNPVPPPTPDDSSSSPIDQISSVSTDGSGTLLSPEPDAGDDLGQMLEWIGWGANALLVVSYFMWLYRTDQNCRHLSAIMRFNPQWAVWCYFVPPLNFFQPLQVMQEIWRVSRNPRTWHNDRHSVLVAVWWVLTLGTIGLALYLRLHPVDAQNHAAQANAARLFVLLKVVQISWYGVFLTMVTVIIHRQHLLVREARRRGEPED